MPVPSASMLTRILNSPEVGPVLGRAAVGGLAGGLFGRHVTPSIFGYEGSPAATNASTLIDAVMGGTMAGMGPAGIKAWAKARGPMFGPQLGGAIIASEAMPVGMNMLTEGTRAARAVADKPTGQSQVTSMLKLPETRGAGIGAALAALGAIGTGSLRPKREGERINRTGRLGMIKNDLKLYILPAMLAGGLMGHGTREA